jgi:hypothetical protein
LCRTDRSLRESLERPLPAAEIHRSAARRADWPTCLPQLKERGRNPPLPESRDGGLRFAEIRPSSGQRNGTPSKCKTPFKKMASARSELRPKAGSSSIDYPPKEKRLSISASPGGPYHQRESSTGPAGGGGRGTDDDCALGCWGLCWGIGTACWDGPGDVKDIFCLMSSSTACSIAMFWAI